MKFFVRQGVIFVESVEFLIFEFNWAQEFGNRNRKLKFFLRNLTGLIFPGNSHCGRFYFLACGRESEHDLLVLGCVLDGRVCHFKTFCPKNFKLHFRCLHIDHQNVLQNSLLNFFFYLAIVEWSLFY